MVDEIIVINETKINKVKYDEIDNFEEFITQLDEAQNTIELLEIQNSLFDLIGNKDSMEEFEIDIDKI